RAFASARAKHRLREVRGDDAAREARPSRKHCGDVEGARAEIDIGTRGRTLPAERSDRTTPPGRLDFAGEEVIEEIVARRDLGEDALDVASFPGATRGCQFHLGWHAGKVKDR